MKDINYILKMIPHRYPFLLVDKIIKEKERKEIKTLKNVTINEPFFSGHNKVSLIGIIASLCAIILITIAIISEKISKQIKD